MSDDSLPAGWIKCASKNRTGKMYYFNKLTGETSWTPPTASSSKSATTSTATGVMNPGRMLSQCKTPAQDRLKRLMSNLSKKREPKTAESPKRAKQKTNTDTKANLPSSSTSTSTILAGPDQTSKSEVKSATADLRNSQSIFNKVFNNVNSCYKGIEKKLLGKRKIFQEDCKEAPGKIAKIESTSNYAIDGNLLNQIGVKSDISDKHSKHEKEQSKFTPNEKKSTSCLLVENKKKEADKKGKNLSCSPSKTNFLSSPRNGILGPNQNETKQFEPSLKCRKDSLNSPKKVQIESKSFAKPFTSPKKAASFCPTKNIANKRMQELRRYLNSKQKSTEANNNSVGLDRANDVLMKSSTSNFAAIPLKNTISDSESMDWEDIGDDVDDNIKLIRQEPDGNLETLSDYYDTVKCNLFRMSAESASTEKRRSYSDNCYYFVIDTNVFLTNLSFLDDLRKMKFADNSFVTLVVPYCVLQELDKLKVRSNDSIKTRVVRAIKFLNAEFQLKDSNIIGESVRESKEKLIDITSPDDSILNCCLQLKTKAKNVILLTNDVNLSNKAIVNQVKVTNKDDLVQHTFADL